MSNADRGKALPKTEQVQTVACALCQSEAQSPFQQREGFQIVRCQDCGLRYVSPRLSTAALDREYNDQQASPTPYYINTSPEDRRTFEDRLGRIEQHTRPAHLLDLGCGPGTMLQVASERGWQAVGVDLNRTSIAHAKSLGLNALAGTFPHPELGDQRFDAITMNDFIEHVPDPVGILSQVRQHLSPGGVAFLTTPDAGSLMARLFGASWLHVKPREHLFYFDRANIRDLCQRAGLEPLWMGAMGRRRNLRVVRERLGEYSSLAGKAAGLMLPTALVRRWHVPINLLDEVGLIARASN
ncbi:MAG TPA: class I SAM-dependent methyltransferase [Planctomycetes bacterium]|nr:class I SAM-dependent methyltransferase [Planctomycetota bacterium]HIL38630.1 class I SAM-dependent methyltransferase [Planctomycetota bacterium]